MPKSKKNKRGNRYEVRSYTLAKYIRESYMHRPDRIGALNFLGGALDQKKYKSFHREIALLKGQLNKLLDLKRVGIIQLQDGTDINSIASCILILLDKIEAEHTYLLIRKSFIEQHADQSFNFRAVKNKNKEKKSDNNQLIDKIKKHLSIKTIGLSIVLIIVISLAATNITWLSDSHQSPLDQVTTWNNPGADYWAIHIRSYSRLQSAIDTQNKYGQRGIKIVQLENNRFYLFIFKASESEATSEWDGEIKKKWPNSGVIPYDKCRNRLDSSGVFYICD